MILRFKFVLGKTDKISMIAQVLCGSELPYTGMLERVEQELVLKV